MTRISCFWNVRSESYQAQIVEEGELEIMLRGRVRDTAGLGRFLGELGAIDGKPDRSTAIARASEKENFITRIDCPTCGKIHKFNFMTEESKNCSSCGSKIYPYPPQDDEVQFLTGG